MQNNYSPQFIFFTVTALFFKKVCNDPMLVSPCRLLFLSHLIYEINDSLKHLSGVRRGEFYPLRSQRSTLGCYSTLSNNLCPETLKLDLPNVKGDEGNRWSLFRCERYIAYTFHLHLSSILDLCLH